MVTGIILWLSLIFSEPLEETRYNLLLNPYGIPRNLDPGTWHLWMWQNRITVMVFGLLLQFFTLRGLERRERLLR